ncbi:MAG: extracellular solute-binding protein, partial [Clostridiaceae bacterium]|nr:extracellular solute-binding protein [Clostridiaceae bacterium]
FIDRRIEGLDSNFLSFNYYETISYLLDHLYMKGHRRISLVTGPASFSSETECIRAYNDFHEKKSLNIEEELIHSIRNTKEDAFRLGAAYLQHQKPTALISTSQTILSGLRQAAELTGLIQDNELELISFGQDIWSTRHTASSISSTMRPAHQLGRRAARLLTENLSSPLLFEKKQLILNDKINSREIAFANHKIGEASDKPLRLLLLDSPNARAVIKLQPNFTDKTGIRLEPELCDHLTLLEQIMQDQKEKKYDIYMYDNPWLDLLVREDCLQNLTEFVFTNKMNQQLFLFDLLERVGSVRSSYFGVPFLYGPQLLLYRQDLFADPQLQQQFEKQYLAKLAPPKTWSEFNAIAAFFTRSVNPASPVEFGTSIAAGGQATFIPELMPRLWAYGADIFDRSKQVTVDTPEFRRGLSSFCEIFNSCEPAVLNYNVEQTVADFYNGKTAMLVGFASFIADINNYGQSQIGGRVAYANIPGHRSVLGSWGLGIAKNTKSSAQAQEFLKWACDPTMSTYFAILDGQSPLQNVYSNDELVNHHPWLPLIYKTYDSNRKRSSITSRNGRLIPITQIEQVLYEKIKAQLTGRSNLEQTVKTLQLEIEKLKNN